MTTPSKLSTIVCWLCRLIKCLITTNTNGTSLDSISQTASSQNTLAVIINMLCYSRSHAFSGLGQHSETRLAPLHHWGQCNRAALRQQRPEVCTHIHNVKVYTATHTTIQQWHIHKSDGLHVSKGPGMPQAHCTLHAGWQHSITNYKARGSTHAAVAAFAAACC